jgi:hypothetical protein
MPSPGIGIELFEDPTWQMERGERAAIVGVLNQLRPDLAIEIGTAEGAGLRHIAAHAREVHSFDLSPPSLPVPDNAVLHTGDSHELLPAALARFAEQGRNVDFVLVDGDHSADGVMRDLEDLLESPALTRTVIVMHDAANEDVRRGLEAVDYRRSNVAYVDLDWVCGRLCRVPYLQDQLWYGLGLVLVGPALAEGTIFESGYYPVAHLLAEARERKVGLDPLQRRVEELEGDLNALRRSASWRLTAPLRSVKHGLRRDGRRGAQRRGTGR